MEAQSSSLCPYCNAPLNPRPTRKKNCPHCGNSILVRQGQLLTEEQAEQERLKERDERWIQRLLIYGVTPETYDGYRLQLEQQFGFPPSVRDTVWRVFNALIGQIEPKEMVLLYSDMAHFVEEEGRDPKPFWIEGGKWREQECRQYLLMVQQNRFFKYVRVNTCNDTLVCPACRAAAEKVYTIEEALEQMPIPGKCQNERGCRCTYSTVLKP